MPMDIEWAKDGTDGKLYIVQARPETVASQHGGLAESYALKETGKVLVERPRYRREDRDRRRAGDLRFEETEYVPAGRSAGRRERRRPTGNP